MSPQATSAQKPIPRTPPDAAHQSIGKVPLCWTMAINAGVADDDGPIGHLQHVLRHLWGGMSEVQNHSTRCYISDNTSAKISQATIAEPMQRAAQIVVKGTLQTNDTATCAPSIPKRPPIALLPAARFARCVSSSAREVMTLS